MVIRRLKTETQTKKESFIPMKCPPIVTRLLSQYLLVIRPVKEHFAFHARGAEGRILYKEYMWAQNCEVMTKESIYNRVPEFLALFFFESTYRPGSNTNKEARHPIPLVPTQQWGGSSSPRPSAFDVTTMVLPTLFPCFRCNEDLSHLVPFLNTTMRALPTPPHSLAFDVTRRACPTSFPCLNMMTRALPTPPHCPAFDATTRPCSLVSTRQKKAPPLLHEHDSSVHLIPLLSTPWWG